MALLVKKEFQFEIVGEIGQLRVSYLDEQLVGGGKHVNLYFHQLFQ